MKQTENVLFYMRRYSVCLKTTIQPNGHLKIEPHNCLNINLRLWQCIAQTQNTLGQSLLNASKKAKPDSVLRSLFHAKGWIIRDTPEQMPDL